nr:ATP-binding protein [Duganella guangzhouensis]
MRRILCFLLLAAVALLASASAGDAPWQLRDASWQMTPASAYTTPSSELDSTRLPGRWQRLALPAALPALAAPGGNTVAVEWLRLTPPAANTATAAAAQPWAIYSARVKVEGTIAVYVNGRLAQRVQAHGQLWDSLFTPLWIDLAPARDAPVREILIRLEHSPHSRAALASLWLGPAAELRDRYHLRNWLQRDLPATLNAAFLAVGVFALAIWLRRRSDPEYLLFFWLAVVSCAAHLHYYTALPIRADWFGWITSNALFWLVMVLHLFLRKLHRQPLTWLTRAVVGATLAVSVLSVPELGVLPIFPSTSLLVPAIYALVVLMSTTVCLTAAACSWRRSREGLLLASGLGLCTLLGVPDWLLHNNVVSVEGWFTGAYTNAVTFAMFGVLMYRRYLGAIREVEQLNASLEQRLQAREAELDVIHQQLRSAARQQTISDERQRLMQDMHDGLGSSLINAIRSVDRAEVSTAQISHILKGCLDDLKLTIDSMEPVDNDLLLLLASLRYRLAPRLDDAGIQLHWDVQTLPALPWLEPGKALHILRIIQESIANILHHTGATEIRLGTSSDADGIAISISDNGGGFDLARALSTGGGRGLRNQQRRAAALNGAVDWKAIAGGTRFTLRLPLA